MFDCTLRAVLGCKGGGKMKWLKEKSFQESQERISTIGFKFTEEDMGYKYDIA